MKILVTGAKGFVGRNLCSQLENIRQGKARGFEDLVTVMYCNEVFDAQRPDTFGEMVSE